MRYTLTLPDEGNSALPQGPSSDTPATSVRNTTEWIEILEQNNTVDNGQEHQKLKGQVEALPRHLRGLIWLTTSGGAELLRSDPRIYEDTLSEINLDRLTPVESLVDCAALHLTEQGAEAHGRVLKAITYMHHLNYCPWLGPIVATALHWMSEREAFAVASALLSRTPSCLLQTKLDSWLMLASVERLARRQTPRAVKTLLKAMATRTGAKKFPDLASPDLAAQHPLLGAVAEWLCHLKFWPMVRIIDCLVVSREATIVASLALAVLRYWSVTRGERAVLSAKEPLQASFTATVRSIRRADNLLATCFAHKVTASALAKLRKQVRAKCVAAMQRTGTSLAVDGGRSLPQYTHAALLVGSSDIVTEQSGLARLLDSLRVEIPTRFCMSQLHKAFATDLDGYSLKTLFKRCEYLSPTVMFIRTTGGHVFGAYLTNPWAERKRSRYFGNGESFVFSLLPSFNVHRWVGMDSDDVDDHPGLAGADSGGGSDGGGDVPSAMSSLLHFSTHLAMAIMPGADVEEQIRAVRSSSVSGERVERRASRSVSRPVSRSRSGSVSASRSGSRESECMNAGSLSRSSSPSIEPEAHTQAFANTHTPLARGASSPAALPIQPEGKAKQKRSRRLSGIFRRRSRVLRRSSTPSAPSLTRSSLVEFDAQQLQDEDPHLQTTTFPMATGTGHGARPLKKRSSSTSSLRKSLSFSRRRSKSKQALHEADEVALLEHDHEQAYAAGALQTFMHGSDSCIAIGGGSQGHAIELDEDLLNGRSAASQVFGSAPLTGDAASADFRCAALEVWSFELPEPRKKARKLFRASADFTPEKLQHTACDEHAPAVRVRRKERGGAPSDDDHSDADPGGNAVFPAPATDAEVRARGSSSSFLASVPARPPIVLPARRRSLQTRLSPAAPAAMVAGIAAAAVTPAGKEGGSTRASLSPPFASVDATPSPPRPLIAGGVGVGVGVGEGRGEGEGRGMGRHRSRRSLNLSLGLPMPAESPAVAAKESESELPAASAWSHANTNPSPRRASLSAPTQRPSAALAPLYIGHPLATAPSASTVHGPSDRRGADAGAAGAHARTCSTGTRRSSSPALLGDAGGNSQHRGEPMGRSGSESSPYSPGFDINAVSFEDAVFASASATGKPLQGQHAHAAGRPSLSIYSYAADVPTLAPVHEAPTAEKLVDVGLFAVHQRHTSV